MSQCVQHRQSAAPASAVYAKRPVRKRARTKPRAPVGTQPEVLPSVAENRRLWYNSGDYEDYGQTPTTDKKDHIKGIYDESDGNHKGFLGYYSPDTSAFTNAAQHI